MLAGQIKLLLTYKEYTMKNSKKTIAKKKPIEKAKKTTAVATPVPTKQEEFIPRPLCFTTSYNRPYELYNTINSVLNQTYKDIKYSVAINIDNKEDEIKYKSLLNPFLSDKRLSLLFTQNKSQHENYLYPIKNGKYENYNLFIKLDDDDIYKSDYIESIINIYKDKQPDVISAKVSTQINGNKIEFGSFESIGIWQPDVKSETKFGMPFTYAFNKKALSILLKLTTSELSAIHPFEDPGWRTKWRDGGIKSYVIDKFNCAVYNIHGKNTSSSFMYNKSGSDKNYLSIDNDHFSLCIFEHNYWTSYIYLNKRNSRMYHIDNDDHGAFELNNDSIKIIWDDWGEEIFYKKKLDHNMFFYSVHK